MMSTVTIRAANAASNLRAAAMRLADLMVPGGLAAEDVSSSDLDDIARAVDDAKRSLCRIEVWLGLAPAARLREPARRP
jgi:hypothetical protein